MTEPVVVIRASSLSSYFDCPRRAAARLFRTEIEAAGYRLARPTRGVAGAIGSAVHRGAEVSLTEKAKTGRLPPLNIATDAAIESLRFQTDTEVLYDGPNGATHNRAAAEQQTLAMTSSYHRVIAPQISPILIETRLEAQVEEGVVLSGQSDVIAREPGAVRDLKTGGRQPRAVGPQLGAYSLLSRTHNWNVSEVRIDFLRRVRAGKPQPNPVSMTLDIAHAETAALRVLSAIVRDLKAFREGDPETGIKPGDPWSFPANPASTLCSARWCSAFGTDFCHEGGVTVHI